MHQVLDVEQGPRSRRPIRLVGNLVLLVLSSLVTFMMVEGLLLLLVATPSLAPPGPVRQMVRELYLRNMDLIQYDPACARYDPELSYTLRPGNCTFASTEFEVGVAVNRLGLRDDEASLVAPHVVVLGDSHAMGWGVEQDETFAQVIEARTGLRVLNAAVSSYGTARALLNLQRIDTDSLRTIILQYCDNDILENQAFADNGNRLPIMSPDEYERIVAAHRAGIGYLFGEHFVYLFKSRLLRRLRPRRVAEEAPAEPALGPAHEAELFLNVLRNGGVDLSGIQVIVLEAGTYGMNDDGFVREVEKQLAADPSTLFGTRITTVDITPHLSKDAHYFVVDDHPNAAGHRALADLLLQNGIPPR